MQLNAGQYISSGKRVHYAKVHKLVAVQGDGICDNILITLMKSRMGSTIWTHKQKVIFQSFFDSQTNWTYYFSNSFIQSESGTLAPSCLTLELSDSSWSMCAIFISSSKLFVTISSSTLPFSFFLKVIQVVHLDHFHSSLAQQLVSLFTNGDNL